MTSRRKLIKTAASITLIGGALRAANAGASSGLDLLGFDETFRALTGGDTRPAGDKVKLEVPELVSNGAFVTVTARSALPDIDMMHLLIDKHAVSHVASMRPTGPAYCSLSIRIAHPCTVTVLVSTSGGWLRQDAPINDVQIGCEV